MGFSARRSLHRRHQFVKGDKIEHPPDVVGKRGQAELSSNLLQTSHQECALIHPLFDRAERVLDKQWMYQSAFLMRGLEKVRAEFSLTALAYNIRRVLNLVAFDKLMAAVKAAPG